MTDYRAICEQAGAVYAGVQEGLGYSLILFNSKVTGTTLGLKDTELTIAAVEAKLRESNAKWRENSMNILLTTLLTYILCISAFGHTPKAFLADHESVLRENVAAEKIHAYRFENLRDVEYAVHRGILVPIQESDALRIAHRLPADRRFARPVAVHFIEQLSTEFYSVFHHPLVIDSAVRPTNVQKRLARWNSSAAPATGDRASTHERGISIDLSVRLSRAETRWLIMRLMYYRAIGSVLVIQERACWHLACVNLNLLEESCQWK